MPTVALSTLEPNDIRTAIGALRTTVRGIARMLGISHGTVTNYLNGRSRIPQSTADRLRPLLIGQMGELLTPVEKAALTTADLAAQANKARNEQDLAAGRHQGNEGFPKHRLPRRVVDPSTAHTFPAYRIRAPYSTLTVAALRGWARVCYDRHRHARSAAHARDYQLELADIKAVMARIPADVKGGNGQAWDITITSAEWGMVSRALRHHAQVTHPEGKIDGPAYVLYQHWRRNKGRGFPFVPVVLKADRDELIAKLSRPG
jgi:plasmid maintenance system antidote protein VapI